MVSITSHLVLQQLLSPVNKVPLLLLGTYLVHRATTSPNPPPKNDATEKFGKKKDVMSFSLPFIQKCIFLASTLGESAVILSSKSILPLSDKILSYLTRGDHNSVSNIQLTPVWAAGWGLVLAGSLVRLWCFRTLGRFFTFELAVGGDQRLITEGPYSVVRHPSYTGALMFFVGSSMSLMGSGSWFAARGGLATLGGKIFAFLWTTAVTAAGVTLVRRTAKEDQVLRNHFGKEWDEYAKRTPCRILPYVY